MERTEAERRAFRQDHNDAGNSENGSFSEKQQVRFDRERFGLLDPTVGKFGVIHDAAEADREQNVEHCDHLPVGVGKVESGSPGSVVNASGRSYICQIRLQTVRTARLRAGIPVRFIFYIPAEASGKIRWSVFAS